MNKPSWLFWVVAALALLWGAFAVFDFYMTTSGNEAYLQDYDPAMIAWIQGFPLWRIALWGISVASAVLGSLLMLARRRAAVSVLWFGVATMLIGFIGHDLMMADGLRYYGRAGMIASVIIVFITIAIALYASRAKQRGYLI